MKINFNNGLVSKESNCSIKAVKMMYDEYHYAEDGKCISAVPLVNSLKGNLLVVVDAVAAGLSLIYHFSCRHFIHHYLW